MSPRPPSRPPGRPPGRLARAMVFTTVCVSLTLLGHVLASRDAVPPLALATGGALVLGVSWLLAGHQRSLVTILSGLLGGQFVMHVLFAAFHSDAIQAHAAHSASGHAGTPSGPAMTLAHLAAAAGSAWWLWRGERLAWQLAHRLGAVAALSIAWLRGTADPHPIAEPLWAPAPRALPLRPLAGVLLRHSLVLRGPPSRSLLLPAA